jgi:hypothetical protein
MTYATSNPPQLVIGAITGTGSQIWSYRSTDSAADVDTAGYITNGGELGMRVGDVVIVTDTNDSPPDVRMMAVNSVSATAPGAVDLQDTVSADTDTD